MIKISKQNAGFTLIEMMIGLLLTSLFIGGIAQVFSRTSKNFTTQRTLSYMMEDARFALDKINSEFRRTGFLTNRLLDVDTTIFPQLEIDSTAGVYSFRNIAAGGGAGTLLTMAAGQTIAGATNLIAVPASDNVVIRYQLSSGADLINNQLSPCTNGFTLTAGETNADGHMVAIVFYMAPSATAGSNVLFCRAYRENLDTGITQTINMAAPLISNIERFRVLYGQTNATAVDLGLAAILGTIYRTSTQVTNSATAPVPLPWRDIESVRLSIALRSEASNISIDDPGNYTINGQFSIPPTAADVADKRLYRVFSTTVAFR